MNKENQIRLTRKGLSDEVIFFLEDTDKSKIHNRMAKFNIGFDAKDSSKLLGTIFKNSAPIRPLMNPKTAKRIFDYHGEIKQNHIILDSTLDQFLKKMVSSPFNVPLPKGYEFYELGVSLNAIPDANGKLGNIEVKYIQKNIAVLPGINPDPMIVINVHIRRGIKDTIYHLLDLKLIESCRKFLLNSTSYFTLNDNDIVEMMRPGTSVRNNFNSSAHALTTDNLAYYYSLHKIPFSLVLRKEVENRNVQRKKDGLLPLPLS